MPVRRAHTKSRHGCIQCKKARTKCDEQKPSCTRCVRREQPCSLSDPHAALIVIHDSQSAPTLERQDTTTTEITASTSVSASDTPGATPPEPTPVSSGGSVKSNIVTSPAPAESSLTQSELTRLILMNHYSAVVCETIARLTHGKGDENGLNIWRHIVPQLAFDHEFLLHGLLGISALHLAMVHPSQTQKYTSLTTHHLDLGLAMFRPHLSNFTPDNVDALFAFSCVTALQSFGFYHTHTSRSIPLSKIYEGLTLVRGTSAVVKGGIQWLQNGPWGFGDLMEILAGVPELPPHLEDVCTTLLERVPTTITTSTQSHIYTAAIDVVKRSLSLALTKPHTQVTMISFPIMVPPEFFEMICIGEPLALAVLANYTVILHWMGDCIWLDSWGMNAVDAIRQALPPDWHPCVAWAVQEVGLSPHLP